MPIVKGQYGKHESVLQVQFGLGDIRMTKATNQNEVQLLISQGPEGQIGREDNEGIGKSTDEFYAPDVVFFFDKPESINAMIHTLSELQKALFEVETITRK